MVYFAPPPSPASFHIPARAGFFFWLFPQPAHFRVSIVPQISLAGKSCLYSSYSVCWFFELFQLLLLLLLLMMLLLLLLLLGVDFPRWETEGNSRKLGGREHFHFLFGFSPRASIQGPFSTRGIAPSSRRLVLREKYHSWNFDSRSFLFFFFFEIYL